MLWGRRVHRPRGVLWAADRVTSLRAALLLEMLWSLPRGWFLRSLLPARGKHNIQKIPSSWGSYSSIPVTSLIKYALLDYCNSLLKTEPQTHRLTYNCLSTKVTHLCLWLPPWHVAPRPLPWWEQAWGDDDSWFPEYSRQRGKKEWSSWLCWALWKWNNLPFLLINLGGW